MQRILTMDLVPGMITAEDIYTYNDQMVLPKDTVLTDKMITRLEFYSILSIRIKDASAAVPSQKKEKDPSPTYSERIKSSKEFQVFEKRFFESVDTFKDNINDIVRKNAPLNVDSLLAEATSLIEEGTTTIHIFDMLHNMRQYDDLTYTHCINVALICNVFGRWLKYNEAAVEVLTLCGLLHDIGKLLIPDHIIKKPAKLTDEEYRIIKTHPTEGYNILKTKNIDPRIKNAALMHHERCDGSGYPNRLSGVQIDKYAKIVAIADVYDAMTAARVYRGPLCPFEVIDIFIKEGLQKYEAEYILTFLHQITNTYIHNRVRISNGMEGDIVLINRLDLAHPVVQCDDKFIDLSQDHRLKIETIL